MTLYLFSASTYFTFLLFSQFKDNESSKMDSISWLVIILASALWILVIPISLIEIRSRTQAKVRLEETEKAKDLKLNSQQIESVELLK